jgi:hypothetical protein
MSAFAQLASKLASQGVKSPGGLAASIGNQKYGASTMQQAAAQKQSVQSVLRARRGGKK